MIKDIKQITCDHCGDKIKEGVDIQRTGNVISLRSTGFEIVIRDIVRPRDIKDICEMCRIRFLKVALGISEGKYND